MTMAALCLGVAERPLDEEIWGPRRVVVVLLAAALACCVSCGGCICRDGGTAPSAELPLQRASSRPASVRRTRRKLGTDSPCRPAEPATLLSRDRLPGLFCSRSVFAPLFAQHEVRVLVDAVERGRRTVARAAVPSRQRRLARTPRAEREGATMRRSG
jgi:hypothetical protein